MVLTIECEYRAQYQGRAIAMSIELEYLIAYIPSSIIDLTPILLRG
jgi:hypothetical protein